jgi:hypothetical protein
VRDVVADPAQRSGQGLSQLSQAMAQEANVLAYIDVFGLVAIIAVVGAIYVGWPAFLSAARSRQSAAEGPA